MIVALRGSDSYLARRVIRQIIEKYLTKHPGSLAVDRYNAERPIEFSDLSTASLFAEPKLTVIEKASELSAENQRALASFLKQAGADTIVVWDGGILETELADCLQQAEKKIAVEPLIGAKLASIVQEIEREVGAELSSEDRKRLLELAGSNLWLVESELKGRALGGDSALLGSSSRPPFAFYGYVSRRDWLGLRKQLRQDCRSRQPFDLILGELAAAYRKYRKQIPDYAVRIELLLRIDLMRKSSQITDRAAFGLLAAHILKPTLKTVQLELS